MVYMLHVLRGYVWLHVTVCVCVCWHLYLNEANHAIVDNDDDDVEDDDFDSLQRSDARAYACALKDTRRTVALLKWRGSPVHSQGVRFKRTRLFVCTPFNLPMPMVNGRHSSIRLCVFKLRLSLCSGSLCLSGMCVENVCRRGDSSVWFSVVLLLDLWSV